MEAKGWQNADEMIISALKGGQNDNFSSLPVSTKRPRHISEIANNLF